jgi:hypothetical protein
LPVTVPDSEKPPWLAEMWHTVEPGPFLDATWVIDCPWKVKVRSKARGWKTAVLLARGCAVRPPGLASPALRACSRNDANVFRKAVTFVAVKSISHAAPPKANRTVSSAGPSPRSPSQRDDYYLCHFSPDNGTGCLHRNRPA